jgi:hypothetical protein
MKYNLKTVIEFAQEQLNIKTDGIIGNNTIKIIDDLKLFPISYSSQRKVIAYVQHFLSTKGIKIVIDGYYGEQTDYLLNSYIEYLKTGKVKAWRIDNKLNIHSNLKSKYPSYNKLDEFYGTVDEIPSKLIKVKIPYIHNLAWNINQKITYVSCHKLIAEPYQNILEEVFKVYNKDVYKLNLNVFGGCYNKRKMRGGNKWSTHSYGIAFDYDPENNQLKWGRDKAEFAKPDYADWLNIWNKYDAINLGEVKNYDWQHFQFSN